MFTHVFIAVSFVALLWLALKYYHFKSTPLIDRTFSNVERFRQIFRFRRTKDWIISFRDVNGPVTLGEQEVLACLMEDYSPRVK